MGWKSTVPSIFLFFPSFSRVLFHLSLLHLFLVLVLFPVLRFLELQHFPLYSHILLVIIFFLHLLEFCFSIAFAFLPHHQFALHPFVSLGISDNYAMALVQQ